MLWPVKSYKLSALQCHYVLQPPPISPLLSLSRSLFLSPDSLGQSFFFPDAPTAFLCTLDINVTLSVRSIVDHEPLVLQKTSGFYRTYDLSHLSISPLKADETLKTSSARVAGKVERVPKTVGITADSPTLFYSRILSPVSRARGSKKRQKH